MTEYNNAQLQQMLKDARIEIALELINKFFASRLEVTSAGDVTNLNDLPITLTIGEINAIIAKVWEKYGL